MKIVLWNCAFRYLIEGTNKGVSIIHNVKSFTGGIINNYVAKENEGIKPFIDSEIKVYFPILYLVWNYNMCEDLRYVKEKLGVDVPKELIEFHCKKNSEKVREGKCMGIWIVFESVEEAKKFAEEILRMVNNVELIVKDVERLKKEIPVEVLKQSRIILPLQHFILQ